MNTKENKYCNDNVEKIYIYDNDTTIFTSGKYSIPLYQRSYAWEDKEISQLLDDINSIDDDKDYYIGSLIVSETDNCFEVIDGQQRLTTLYLLLSCMRMNLNNNLVFACRDKSNYSLINIEKILDNKIDELEYEKIDSNIERGIRIIKEYLSNNTFNEKDFLNRLSKVVLFRIEVPPHTDLNRYFEIMNIRGEQLTQTDILKARLMKMINDKFYQHAFSIVWDACSDMTGYVQMHFNTCLREILFRHSWDKLSENNNLQQIAEYESRENIRGKAYFAENSVSIANIIQSDFSVNNYDGTDENDQRVRFESTIEFSYFLIHVLKVFTKVELLLSSTLCAPIFRNFNQIK